MGNEAPNPTPAAAPAAQPPPAPAAPAAPPPAAAAPAAPAPAEWTSSLDETVKGYVQNKGFKSAGDVANAYMHLEKLHSAGPDKLIKIPENLDVSTPEGRAVFERLGAPKEAKGYDFKTPEGGDPKFAEFVADMSFKAGLPRAQAEKVFNELNARATAMQTERSNEMKAAQQAAEIALKQEWGMAFDKNKNLVDQAARVVGIGEKETASLTIALGPKKAADLLLKIGQSIGEANFVPGQSAGGDNMAPNQAASRLQELQADKGWVDRYLSGDVAARKEMERLQQMKTGGAMTRL